MRRRLYLASVGIVLAGCAEDADETPVVPEETETPTENPIENEPPTETETPTDGTPTESDSDEEIVDGEEEEETESEPADQPEAEELLNDVQSALSETRDTYATQGDVRLNVTILDIDATTEEFDTQEVLSTLRGANDALRDIEDLDDVEGIDEELSRLRAEEELLRRLIRVQERAHDPVPEFELLCEAFEDEADAVTFDNHRDEVSDAVDVITDRLEIARDAYEDYTDAGGSISVYSEKLDQFETEVAGFEGGLNAVETGEEGLDHLRNARSSYDSEDYNTAQLNAEDAESTLESAISEFDSINAPTISSLLENCGEVLEPYIEEADEVYRDAAEAADE